MTCDIFVTLSNDKFYVTCIPRDYDVIFQHNRESDRELDTQGKHNHGNVHIYKKRHHFLRYILMSVNILMLSIHIGEFSMYKITAYPRFLQKYLNTVS